jgi:DNA-directed RNA polymerase subunit RPC12/RpoP
MLSQSKREFELKTINNMVRICIECGNISVLIDDHTVFCKNCNSKFRIKEKPNGSIM